MSKKRYRIECSCGAELYSGFPGAKERTNKICSVDGLDPGEYVQAPLLWSPVGRENVHIHIIAN